MTQVKAKLVKVRVGRQGRLVIPAGVRKSLSIRPGQEFVLRVEKRRLVLQKPEDILAEIQEQFARTYKGVSAVDELIAERRAEALRESSNS